MWLGLSFVILSIFLLGLFQWARSGAGIWRIFSLRQEHKADPLGSAERKEAEEEVKRLERATDRTLLISFKLIGIMALLVWLVLGVSFVIDAFGLNDWLNEMSMSAHRYWSSGVTDRGPQSSVERKNMLRNIGAGLRK